MASELEVLRREKAQFEREMEALRRQQAERIDTNMHAINAAGEKDRIVGAIRETIIIQRHFFFSSKIQFVQHRQNTKATGSLLNQWFYE